MKELKPCPFCGGEAKIEHSYKFGSTTRYSLVKCQNYECGIEGKWIMESTSYASDERAIKAWNRRANE